MFHQAFLAQIFLDLHLRCDAGVISPRQPKDFFAIHAGFARENVLYGVVQDVAHVEHAGDVRRRNDDGIRGLGRAGVRYEAFVVEPELVPLLFDSFGFVGFGNF